jgi:hypothetical protein
MKTFRDDFYKLAMKLKKKECFAFTRFSDGEMLIMQNRKIVIDSNVAYAHDRWGQGSWGPEEHKTFEPEKDGKLREQLIETFKHVQPNYFKGICCKCCVGLENHAWQFSHINQNEENLTWANLLINGNYKLYVEQMLPIMKNYPVVVVVNKLADIGKLPLNVVKDFRIGANCHINDQHLIQEMHEWVETNNVQKHLFLFGAASLSNLLIHDLFKSFPNNTYMDIGSTLNPIMGLDGWKGSRDYLRGYWLKESNHLSEKQCIW